MQVKRVITPEALPSRLRSTGAPVLRCLKNGRFGLTRALCELANLKVGDAINFIELEAPTANGATFLFYKTETPNNAFVLRGNEKEAMFSNMPLLKIFGDAYSFSNLLEKEDFPAIGLKVEVVTPVSYLVAGIGTYYAILPPKKFGTKPV